MKLVVVIVFVVTVVACGPHKQPMSPPEPGAHPVPVEIGWPDGGAAAPVPADALVGK